MVARLALFIAVSLSPIAVAGSAPAPWRGALPPVARERSAWGELIEALREARAYFGMLAAARRMLLMFPDLATKETAYRTIVELIDMGYPFAIREEFVPGDIEP